MNKVLFLGFVLLFLLVFSVFSQTADIQNGGHFKIMAFKEVVPPKPAENMKYVAFDVLVDNTTGNSPVILIHIFGSIEVQDTDGYLYTPSSYADIVKPSINLNSGLDVEPGDLMRGWITVAINKNAQINGLRVRFKTTLTSMPPRLSMGSLQSGWVTIRQ